MVIGVSRSEPLGFPSGAVVKNLPAMQETRVPSLGREDPLGKGKATHLSILAWKIPMDCSPQTQHFHFLLSKPKLPSQALLPPPFGEDKLLLSHSQFPDQQAAVAV